jgi:ATP-dependent exoDNAse (exonuclease V) beta subunit
VNRWIEKAAQVYRELPFIWAHGNRIIHGVIDILLQHPDQSWAIIDYKSGSLPKNATVAEARDHARRFHMQVGAYAEAVLEQFGASQTVDAAGLGVYIHYIHCGRTVKIGRDEWRAALDKIEPYIGKLMAD